VVRRLFVLSAIAACGNVPIDYAPPQLRALGVHNAPVYVARDLMPRRGLPLVQAYPRLGQPAIRRPGERFEVRWIAPVGGLGATASLDEGPAVDLDGVGRLPLPLEQIGCDPDGLCHATARAPATPRLYSLCLATDDARGCSSGALAVVERYADPGSLRLLGLSSGQDLDDGHHFGRLSESSGPDRSQLAWLRGGLVGDDPALVFFHRPA
jgi:hypothetical protein